MEPSRGGEAGRRRRRASCLCSFSLEGLRRRIGAGSIVDVFFFFFFFSGTFFPSLLAPRPPSPAIYSEQEFCLGRLGSGEFEIGFEN